MEQLSFSTILGAWIAAFLTLGIFSYLYRDNPFYKIAEHVFVGVSAGANVLAAERYIEKHNPHNPVVTILCDRGERYFSCL